MSKIKEAKVSSKGQIVIPKDMRDQMGLRAGSNVLIGLANHRLVMVPKPKDPVEALIEIGKEMKIGEIRKEIKEWRKDVKRDAMLG